MAKARESNQKFCPPLQRRRGPGAEPPVGLGKAQPCVPEKSQACSASYFFRNSTRASTPSLGMAL